ncbi:MAG: hypothetical protein QME66_00535 [Candidatus Eisenbacteria bacterium]|nr:hypothetical protein [Candidatus Eisenbacteria bacterium]
MSDQRLLLERLLEDSGLLPVINETPIIREKPLSKEQALLGFREVLTTNPLLMKKAMSSWNETGEIDQVLRLELVKEWVKQMSRQQNRVEPEREKCMFCTRDLPAITAPYRFVIACEKPYESEKD